MLMVVGPVNSRRSQILVETPLSLGDRNELGLEVCAEDAGGRYRVQLGGQQVQPVRLLLEPLHVHFPRVLVAGLSHLAYPKPLLVAIGRVGPTTD